MKKKIPETLEERVNQIEETELRSSDGPSDEALFRQVFDTPHGREVIRRLKASANAIKIDRNDPNPIAAVYKEAQMTMVRRLEKHVTGVIPND